MNVSVNFCKPYNRNNKNIVLNLRLLYEREHARSSAIAQINITKTNKTKNVGKTLFIKNKILIKIL